MAAVGSPFGDMCPGVSVGTVGGPLRHGGSKPSDVELSERQSPEYAECTRVCLHAHACGRVCEVVSGSCKQGAGMQVRLNRLEYSLGFCNGFPVLFHLWCPGCAPTPPRASGIFRPGGTSVVSAENAVCVYRSLSCCSF